MNLLFCIHSMTLGVRKPEFRDKFRYGVLSKHFAQQTSNTKNRYALFGASLAAEEIKMFLLFLFFFFLDIAFYLSVYAF